MSYENARLVGAIATVAIAFWQKNLLVTIVAGMGLFLAYQILVGM
ncbi:AzlD domain-containing protein [Vasconcelosia minhoensis]|nr:AzlD domain-containing protein [Romeria gracilis]